jgi:lipoyl-dependent peroxiredoxin
MKRSASAQWRGNIKQGNGLITTESGSISKIPYSFSKRFGDEKGTNPEEMIGAAHASCFAMAFSGELEKEGMKADTIDVKAIVSLEKAGEGWEIPSIHLQVNANVPGSSHEKVERAANSAKTNCPISKLMNAKITMDFNMTEENSASLQ